MGPFRGRLGDRGGRALAVAVCVLLATGACSTEGVTAGRPPSPTQTADTVQSGTGNTARPAGQETSADKQVANPVRLRIAAIGVSTRVIALRLDSTGRLIAPKSFDRVGWNKAGPEPGEAGVAVIAGHVDSKSGPAVFYRLRELRKGDLILIDRADGSTVRFTVSRLARYPKNRIPDKEVYGSGSGTQLRLITCGGSFDRERRSYRDNIIVFAG